MDEIVTGEVVERKRVTLEDGREGWQMPDGSVRNEKGQYMVMPPTAKPITKLNAGQLARRRAEKAALVAGKAIADAAGGVTVYEGWGAIIRKRAEIALSDDGKAGNDAAKFVGAAAGLLNNFKDAPETVVRHEYTIAPEAMDLLNDIRRMKDG